MKLFLNTWFEGQASGEWSGLEMVFGAGEQRQCLWERGISVLPLVPHIHLPSLWYGRFHFSLTLCTPFHFIILEVAV